MNLFLLSTISENLSSAMGLLTVGMISIFLILGLVVLLGNGLIIFVNRFLPLAEISAPNQAVSPSNQAAVSSNQANVSSNKVAPPPKAFSPSALSAIVAAVEIATQGRGNITEIKKI